MDHLEIVKRLIGPINPVGETHTDEKRLENLRSFIQLTGELVGEIADVAIQKNRHEHSIKKAAKIADEFLTGLVEDLKE